MSDSISLGPRTVAHRRLLERLSEFSKLNELKVALVLINWIQKDDGLAAPTMETIAKGAGIDMRDARRAVAGLEEQGFIRVKFAGGGRPKKGDLKANKIELFPTTQSRLETRGDSPRLSDARNPGDFPPVNGAGNPGDFAQETRGTSRRKPGGLRAGNPGDFPPPTNLSTNLITNSSSSFSAGAGATEPAAAGDDDGVRDKLGERRADALDTTQAVLCELHAAGVRGPRAEQLATLPDLTAGIVRVLSIRSIDPKFSKFDNHVVYLLGELDAGIYPDRLSPDEVVRWCDEIESIAGVLVTRLTYNSSGLHMNCDPATGRAERIIPAHQLRVGLIKFRPPLPRHLKRGAQPAARGYGDEKKSMAEKRAAVIAAQGVH